MKNTSVPNRLFSSGLGKKLNLIFLLTIGLWAVEIINYGTGHRLNAFGINPQNNSPLPGIIFAPFLHGGAGHLFLNTLPFMTLSWFVLLRGFKTWLAVSVFIIILSGLLVWLLARPAHHIGASGLIFGYFGYLVFLGFFEKSFSSVIIASTILIIYGGMIMGVFPLSARVSWESHLYGFLVGILAAWIWQRKSHSKG